MKLHVIQWGNGCTVHLPPGESLPTVVRPDLWVGQGSPYRANGFAVTVGSVVGTERALFGANGLKSWGNGGGHGPELLSWLTPDEGPKDFAEAFLKFWLGWVFGLEPDAIELEHMTGEEARAAVQASGS